MEVHQHTHTPRKKWTHYFWEFLMLFLAVFCGFLAENEREHFVEKKREKRYISMLMEDLKRDTNLLRYYIIRREDRRKNLDSLFFLLTSGKYRESGNDVYFYARISNRYQFMSSDGTLQQLKNSGQLRLIRKQNVIDSIMAYDKDLRLLQSEEERDEQRQFVFREMVNEIFHPLIFSKIKVEGNERPAGNPQLLTSDTLQIYKLASRTHYSSNSLGGTISIAKRLDLKAQRLITILNKEYDLK